MAYIPWEPLPVYTTLPPPWTATAPQQPKPASATDAGPSIAGCPLSDEDTPLVVGKRVASLHRSRRALHLFLWGIGAIAIVLFLSQNVGLVRCPFNDVPAAEKAALRREWRVESSTWAQSRAEFAEEAAAHERASAAHRAELEDWRAQREEEARHRLEVQRRSEGVWWTEPRGEARCRAYGTRAYSAYLRDVPAGLNWLEVCYDMPPVVIHGRNVSKPDKCEMNVSAAVGALFDGVCGVAHGSRRTAGRSLGLGTSAPASPAVCRTGVGSATRYVHSYTRQTHIGYLLGVFQGCAPGKPGLRVSTAQHPAYGSFSDQYKS